jgi:hypothetical protein
MGTSETLNNVMPTGVGTSETLNNILPMTLADIVKQQVNCFLGFLRPGQKNPACFFPVGVIL